SAAGRHNLFRFGALHYRRWERAQQSVRVRARPPQRIRRSLQPLPLPARHHRAVPPGARRDGAWSSAADGAFSRWAEDVPDAAAPWVQLVRLYAVAAGLPEEDRMPFLSDEREALMA